MRGQNLSNDSVGKVEVIKDIVSRSGLKDEGAFENR